MWSTIVICDLRGRVHQAQHPRSLSASGLVRHRVPADIGTSTRINLLEPRCLLVEYDATLRPLGHKASAPGQRLHPPAVFAPGRIRCQAPCGQQDGDRQESESDAATTLAAPSGHNRGSGGRIA